MKDVPITKLKLKYVVLPSIRIHMCICRFEVVLVIFSISLYGNELYKSVMP